MPVKPLDTSVSHLFPDTLIYTYENGGYIQVSDMQVAKGYWLKTTINGYDITGESIDAYTTTLDQGWHMVGGLNQSVEETFDSDCVEAVFGYQNGAYILVSEFLPGHGYWVK
ncbi:MAG: hypothetical protein OMM_13545 [Candidatus Magnetoglobus multicellularis str. Araruama]|uniref:Uncharacterized protein n=1 Tax=Candidatus Magnetoglobus multicellularis str. Araruama TaxID=890399 RepID=A0A1V1NTI1_9BACT|nr:MAG: hypothetical protein OMM_13545 [Candidatus Magnetoglobus multicellularis str. Araruama]